MKDSLAKSICVSITHAGLACPPEIDPKTFSERIEEIKIQSVDFYTDEFYDFSNILDNQQVVFPYLSCIINVNRHPDLFDESAPLRIDEMPIFKEGKEPSIWIRKKMIRNYHNNYHEQLSRIPKKIILDGHSAIESGLGNKREILAEDIVIEDYQFSYLDPAEGIKTAPEGYAETYVVELQRRLPSLVISLNNRFVNIYGHVLACHSWDGTSPRHNRVPVLLQETNEKLYISDGQKLPDNIETLRRIFAEALLATITKMENIYKDRFE